MNGKSSLVDVLIENGFLSILGDVAISESDPQVLVCISLLLLFFLQLLCSRSNSILMLLHSFIFSLYHLLYLFIYLSIY